MTSVVAQRQVGHNIDVRPSSALARGVYIREEQSAKINPSPLVSEEQFASYLLEDYLSPRKLRDLTGVDNLDDVTLLELRVDTIDTSLGNFGVHLPNLLQLKLSDSNINSLRDLGSCLAKLRVLWMSRCGLEDVQGIGSMSNLRELYVSYNEITDVTPCAMLETLEILDLEGNCISDMNQIGTLAWCPKLYSLTLEGNPICAASEINDSSTEYREAVKSLIPHLRVLDDEPLLPATQSPSGSNSDSASNSTRPASASGTKSSASAFDSDWKLLAELMEDGTFTGNETVLDFVAAGRPGTAGRPLTSSYRPGTALRPYTALKSRPGSCPGNNRPSTSRPATSRSADGLCRKSTPSDEGIGEDGSELTSGAVLCGNPYKALSRRQAGKLTSSSKHARTMVAQARERASQVPATAIVIDEQLVGEIQRFKAEHEKRMSELSATKAPQVLVVNYDDAVSLSDEEDCLSEELSSDEGLPRLSFEQRYPQDEDFDSSMGSEQQQQRSPASTSHSSNANVRFDSAFYDDNVSDLSLSNAAVPPTVPQSSPTFVPHPPLSRSDEKLRRGSRDERHNKMPAASEAEPTRVVLTRSTSRTPESPEGLAGASSTLKSKLHKVGNVALLPSKYPSRPL